MATTGFTPNAVTDNGFVATYRIFIKACNVVQTLGDF
jgi:hypothetical protein